MSSPNHPTFDIEDAFSFNFLDYFLATPGNTSPDSSNDLTKYLLATLVFSPLHDDPYMEEISPPKDAKTPVESSILASPSSSVGSSSPVRMPPKRKSTFAAPAMTQAANRQLIADVLWPNMVPNSKKLMEVFIGGLPRSIEGNVTALKPQTLDESITITQRLMEHLNLDEVVAHGAGIFAENLSCIDNKAMQSLVLVDVTPLSLGVAQVRDVMRMDNNVPLRLRENGLSARGLNDLEHEIEKALKSLDENPNEINELKNSREELKNSCKRIKREH
nr:heat shock cognate 70 kDa protein-like [Tanacetum cinerariifolium]